MTLVELRQVMDEAGIARALRRIAHEVLEREQGCEDLMLIGIHTGGVYLAQRLAGLIEEIEGVEVPLGTVDITLYRDDVFEGLPRPMIGKTEIPGRLRDKKVILVDDVLFTGRTVRAALDALNDYGRARRVRLAVLVDRGQRELPVAPDYVGARVDTQPDQSVKVRLAEKGEIDEVVLMQAER
ncbi:MAG: bifunctional pyr operon transcriptional regulator/uracil phosphoribosyltransferase PyrR [Deltaproteobacteria bacterium]|nr:bifunctional pyr operon transcriptional regulator/uracil phosphoribosyltransferase PyrR [Deltaproteobacteria bacterium]